MANEFLKAGGSGLSGPRRAQEAFRDGLRLLDAAAANIEEAGRLFASIADDEWSSLIGEAPAPMRRTLGNVREVGFGRMIPQLATASGEAVQRLRSLPPDEQLRLWSNPVEMFRPGAVGRHAKYMRYATEMAPDEVRRAFEKNGSGWRVRSYDEQRAWVTETAAKGDDELPAHGVDRPGRWAVRNGRVYLARQKVETGLTRRDVEGILRDLEEESA